MEHDDASGCDSCLHSEVGPTKCSTATQSEAASPTQRPPKRRNITLLALIAGIVAFLVGFLPVVGALVGILAVVLGIRSLLTHPTKAMAVTGIVFGTMATLVSVGFTVGVAADMGNASQVHPVVVVTHSAPLSTKATVKSNPGKTAKTNTPFPTPEPTIDRASPSSARAPVPNAAVLEQAAANLKAADDDIQSQFDVGVAEVGTPAGVDWWTKTNLSASSITVTGNAYTKTQDEFGDYDPRAFDDWYHVALLPLSGDLINWYQASDESADRAVYQGKVEADLAAANADIKLVLSGQISQE